MTKYYYIDYSLYGTMTIKANSSEEAKEKFKQKTLPSLKRFAYGDPKIRRVEVGEPI